MFRAPESVQSRANPPRPRRGGETQEKTSRRQGKVWSQEERRRGCLRFSVLMVLLTGEEAARPRCLLPASALGRLNSKLEARRDQQVLRADGASRATGMAATYLTWDPPSA